jgi:hypothetical protein
VPISGSLALPELELSGAVAPEVPISGSLALPELELSGTFKPFEPSDVPEVAAGYWWDAAAATNLGAAGFAVPEMNGHATFNQVQTTVASQPTQLTENGGKQFRMRRAADANPSVISTAGNVQAGWTGATCYAGWFRLPDSSGDISGAGTLIGHNTTTAFRMSLTNLVNTTDRQSVSFSADGAAVVLNQWLNSFDGGWKFLVAKATPGVGVELYVNHNLVAHALTNAPGPLLFDTAAPIFIGCRAASSLANTNTTDWATAYICNGIPSDAELVRLSNYHNPTGVPFN